MFAVWYGVGAGLVLVIAGWATYRYAPRVGPNPIFGVRTGYSMVNRDVWDRSNRAGGLILMLMGLVTGLAGVITPLGA